MTPVQALLAARQAGVSLTVVDGVLRVKSAGPVPVAVIAGLRDHKAALVSMLLSPEAPPAACATCRREPHEPDEACGLTPQTYKPWLTAKAADRRVWYSGVCSSCGRPMHDGDYVCPTPTPDEAGT